MRKKNRILNLMIILEAALLVVVLVVGLMHTGISRITSRRSAKVVETEADISAEEQNAVDVNAVPEPEEEETEEEEDAGEEPEDENENAITGTGSAYEAMIFSEKVAEKMDEMTTEQKVAQLFVTTPEQLTETDQVTVAGEATENALEEYPVGGLVYSAANLQSTTQTDSLIQNTQEYVENAVGVSMFAMIEEIGGENHSPLEVMSDALTVQPSPAALGEEGDPNAISDAAQTRAESVQSSGFDTILGPVADVSTGGIDPDFDEMTYGASSGNVAECVEYDIEGTQAAGVMAVMRAFPGTYEVTNDYSAYQVGIDAGVDCIMVSNQPDNTLTGEADMPCSLSVQVVQELRVDMGFEGLLMTSNLASDVVTDYCSTEEAAVQAVNAGMDILYVRGNFKAAYDAVLDAVNDGTISENMLNNAVGRILTEKMD